MTSTHPPTAPAATLLLGAVAVALLPPRRLRVRLHPAPEDHDAPA